MKILTLILLFPLALFAMGSPLRSPAPSGTGIAPDMGRTTQTLNQIESDPAEEEEEERQQEEEVDSYRFDEPTDHKIREGYTKEEKEFNKNFGED